MHKVKILYLLNYSTSSTYLGFILRFVGASFLFVGRHCASFFGVVEVVFGLHYSGEPLETCTRERRSCYLNEKRSIPAYGTNMAKHCSCYVASKRGYEGLVRLL